ncbi:MAG: ABC transporter permease, partial [Actinocatenispora sp.]
MNSLTGTRTLIRLALRRDRITLPIWIGAMTLMAAASASSVAKLYPTVAERTKFAAGAGSNPATLAMYGPSYDLATLGGAATFKLGTLGAVVAGLMGIFTVIRHTRGDEEPGRLEL